MKRAELVFAILAVILGLAANNSETFYKSKKFETSVYNSGYSIGHIGKSTAGLDWGVLSYTYGIEKFSITAGALHGRARMTDTYIHNYYEKWGYDDWFIEDSYKIDGSGIALGRLILKYVPLSMGLDTKGKFKPLYFNIAPYLETSVLGLVSRNETNYWNQTPQEPTKTTIGYLFPYLELGLSLESSIFYARAGYTQTKKLGSNSIEPSNVKRTTDNSGFSAAMGVNLSLYYPHSKIHSTISYRKKYTSPIINLSGQSIRGKEGTYIKQTDNGFISLVVENSGSVDATTLVAVLKSKGSYPGLTLGNLSPFSVNKGDKFALSIPINTQKALPGEKHYVLEVSNPARDYTIELPFSFSVLPEDDQTTAIVYNQIYDPTDLDYNIPRSPVVPTRKALIVFNESYRNESITGIKVAANTVNTLKKYLTSTLGISTNNIFEHKNVTISELQDVFDAKDGFISKYVKAGEELIVYIVTHGIVKEVGKDKTSFLICYDSNPFSDNVSRIGVPITSIVSNLDQLPSTNYILLLDACYSGIGKGTLAPTTVVKQDVVRPQRGAVITSSDGIEVANIMEDKGHTVFSYHFLKSLQTLANQNKAVTIEDVFNGVNDVNNGIPAYTLRNYRRSQNPQIYGNIKIRLTQ